MKGILGKKIGMTQVFTKEGKLIPVTVIEVEPNVVTQIKTVEKDGYDAIQLGTETIRESLSNKPKMGHTKKANTTPKRFLREIRGVNVNDYTLGQTIGVDIFEAGEIVDVTGTSKGKGFQGVIKRHNQHTGPMGHGSQYHRGVGSLGTMLPMHVLKGKKMPGQMGNVQRTVQNLEIVSVDTENSVILVKGNVPGPKKSLVMIRTAVKKPNEKNAMADLVSYEEATPEVEEPVTEDTTTEDQTVEEDNANAPEQSVVTWNYGSSGNVLVTIANEMGYFAEEGITIEPVAATANADAMSLLASGKVNVVSNAGTSNPLQQIAQGVDISVFGGHMIEGCMPVVALPDTEWNGIESFLGEKVAVNPSYFAFTGAVMDLGVEDPMTAVEWTVFSSYDDALVAVQKGEVKYALMGTGQNLAVQQLAAQGDIKIVSYQSEIMENYSCCRMVAQTSWINENPNTVKAICRALLRAQSWYEANKEEAVTLHAAAIEATEEYVVVKRQYEDGYHIIKIKTPCLLTAIAELAEPRYMSIGGVFDAYKKEIKVLGFEDLKDDLELDMIGLKGSPTNVYQSFTKEVKGAGTILEGLSADEAVKAIMDKLEAKFII